MLRLAVSTLYRLFGNPFYYGMIQRNGELYQGAHEPMITNAEFQRVQALLGRPDNPRPRYRQFSFTGLIRCGECGMMVTAEEKVNRYGSRYTYYHCSKKRRDVRCSQGSVELKALERQILESIDTITISDEFRDWAIRHLREVHEEETSHRHTRDRSLDGAYRECEKKLDRLVGMHLRGLIDEEEYKRHKNDLIQERASLKEKLEDTEGRQDRWLELSEKAFLFANQAKFWFENGSLEEKKEILACLGSNLLLRDKKLQIVVKKPFLIMKEGAGFGSWCARVEEVRTFFVNLEGYFRIPVFRKRAHGSIVSK